MTNTDLVFMVLVGIIGLNQFVIRTHQWKTRMWLFWIVQLSSVSFGSWLILWGIPGFTEELDVINWLVGLLFINHAVRNHMRLQKFQRQQKEEAREAKATTE